MSKRKPKLTKRNFAEVMANIREHSSGDEEAADAYVATLTNLLELHVAGKNPSADDLVATLDMLLDDMANDEFFDEDAPDPRDPQRD
ncbi:hypothetical protein [Myxococcus sp. AB056]|uniref:hypothetical protein n=1 Tax=Myxococcus sp. AB056 TaxID=2562792 RepID=UPI0011476090|nr:hypothetical protein [Myxococcus sp. AB056]